MKLFNGKKKLKNLKWPKPPRRKKNSYKNKRFNSLLLLELKSSNSKLANKGYRKSKINKKV